MSRRVAVRGVAVGLLIAAGCSSLPPAELDACGDGIVEPAKGEDCDRDGDGCGAPGTAEACRLICTTSADCPATSACGHDGVCAVPDGHFAHANDQAWTSPFVLVGDTGGDGDPELVGLDDIAIDVRVGGAGATFGPSDPIPNLPIFNVPRIADLTGDGRDDVAVSVGIGLHVLTGDPDALLAPTFQAALPVPSVGPLLAASVPYDAPADGGGTVPATDLLVALRAPMAPPDCLLPGGCEVLLFGDQGIGLPRDLDQLAGDRVRWARRPPQLGELPQQITIALPFVDDPGMIGDQSGVWLARGNLAIPVPPPFPVPPAIELLGQVPITQGKVTDAHLADLDGDGLADLLITAIGAGDVPTVLFGKGRADATFAAPVELRIRPAGTLDPLANAPAPIAWGDLDGDGRVELIGEQFALRLSCLGSACSYTVAAFVDQPWAHALVADVNGDGRPDLIASRTVGSTVDVLLGTGVAGLWNDSSFAASGEVGALRRGDYDGNGVDDVALAVAAGDPGDGVAIAVAFGRPNARLDPPIAMGTVGHALAFEPIVAPAPGRFDTIDDLLVVADRNGVRAGAILFGSTSQRLIAPLIPQDDPTVPSALSTFELVDAIVPLTVEGGGGASLAALVTTINDRTLLPVESSLRFFTADGDGILSEHYGGALGAVPFGLRDALYTAIPGVAGQVPLIAGADTSGRVVTVPIDGCPQDCHVLPVRPLVTVGAGRPTALIAADLDHEGALELIALLDGGPDGASELLIWRGGAGTAEHTPIAAGLTPLAVTAITIAVGQPAALVVATRADARVDVDGGVMVAVPDAGGRYPALTSAAAAGLIDRDEPAAVGLSTADVDGDGLDDLIIVAGADPRTPHALAVYTQGAVPGGAGLAAIGAH